MPGLTGGVLFIPLEAAVLLAIPVLLAIAPLPTGIIYILSRGDRAGWRDLVGAARWGLVWGIALVMLLMGLVGLFAASHSTAFSWESPPRNPDVEAFRQAVQSLASILIVYGFCAGLSMAGAAGTLMMDIRDRPGPVQDESLNVPLVEPGDRPWSWGKIAGVVFAVLSILTLATLDMPVNEWKLGTAAVWIATWAVLVSGFSWAGSSKFD